MQVLTQPANPVLRVLGRVRSWPHIWLVLLVAVILSLHFSIINNPPEYVFDEKWYAVDASLILEGKGSFIPQHPPLGRLIIAGGISLFGDNAFGWRFFPVVFGVAGTILLYLIGSEIKLNRKLTLLATFLVALENLSFIQSSVAMLDVFSVTLMLAGFYAYLKGRLGVSSVLIGLSALTKFTGILALVVIALHWLITSPKQVFRLILSFAMSVVVYLAILTLCLYIIFGKFVNPVEYTIVMLQLNSLSTFSVILSNMPSRPWEWLIGYEVITYWAEPHYMAMISTTVWALTIPAMIYMIYKTLKRDRIATFIFTWFTGTYLLWIPLSIITDRTSYIFYFYPTIGAICLAIAVALRDFIYYLAKYKTPLLLALSKWVIPVYALLHLACFVYLSPVPYAVKLTGSVMLYAGIRYLFSGSSGLGTSGMHDLI